MNLSRAPFVATLSLVALVLMPETTLAVTPGRAVLAKMESAYRGRWYKTLTFIQKTTFIRPGVADREQTWWESVRYTPKHGVQLRIDAGNLADGNGSLSTADSTWRVRNGTVASIQSSGNEFLPLIEGVYVQPLDITERQVRAMGIDLDKVNKRSWQGRPTTVVGAASAGDTTSSQFWVDDERLVLVRMIVKMPTGSTLDVFLDGYEKVGGGWLGTKVDIFVDGKLVQKEQYTEWKADVPLPDALFDPSKWTTAPHWGKKP